jgi:hypothetical protein
LFHREHLQYTWRAYAIGSSVDTIYAKNPMAWGVLNLLRFDVPCTGYYTGTVVLLASNMISEPTPLTLTHRKAIDTAIELYKAGKESMDMQY